MSRLIETTPVFEKIFNKFPIVSSFGYISAHKRYDRILGSFKKLIDNYPDAVYVIIGQDNIDLSRMIHESGLEENVIITGFVTEDILINLLNMSDFCVNLRYPTAGETSRSVLQIMSLGKPVIVSNVGWFSELPDDTCLKVDIDRYESAILSEFFELLSANRHFSETVAKNSKEYVKTMHDPTMIAKKLP